VNSPASLGIVFYDGDCGLCNRLVLFLLKRDHEKVLRFAPLSGKMARQWLEEEDLKGESVIFLDGGGIYRKSDAVLRALARLGGFWRIAKGGLWVPPFLRDGVYDFVSRHRRRWFGGAETCPLPTSISTGNAAGDSRLLS
jgi:predicted DCC family thiol-disulfide oxidoreductase YuxK